MVKNSVDRKSEPRHGAPTTFQAKLILPRLPVLIYEYTVSRMFDVKIMDGGWSTDSLASYRRKIKQKYNELTRSVIIHRGEYYIYIYILQAS